MVRLPLDCATLAPRPALGFRPDILDLLAGPREKTRDENTGASCRVLDYPFGFLDLCFGPLLVSGHATTAL